MMRNLFSRSLLFSLLGVGCFSLQAADIALTHVNLIDVEKGRIKELQTVLIRDDKIFALQGGDKKVPEGFALVDLSGKYLMPGLIDAHVHHATEPEGYDNATITRQRLRRLLRGGVTSVRDMGGDVRVLAGLKRQAQLGLIQSPDIYYSVILGGKTFFSDPRTVASARGAVPGHTDWMRAVDESTDFDALMQRTLGTGATGIKIYADVPSGTVAKLAAAAKKAGLKVWSHAYIGPDKPSSVVRAGVETMSHVPDLSAEVIGNYKAWRRKNAAIKEDTRKASFEPKRYGELLSAMVKQGTYLDSTLRVFEHYRERGDNGETIYRHGVMLNKLARDAGVKFAVGTDYVDDKAQLPAIHEELELLVSEGGLSAPDVLKAVTVNNAAVLGLSSQLGTIEEGKRADLVVLNSNPLEDIGRTRDIAHVIKHGEFVLREDDPRLPFVSARKAGSMLWLSGQIGNFPGTMTLASSDVEGQMHQAMHNIRAVLLEHDLELKDIVKCTLMLGDIADWKKASAVYKSYFNEGLPARSAFAASGLALDAKVEIECSAAL